MSSPSTQVLRKIQSKRKIENEGKEKIEAWQIVANRRGSTATRADGPPPPVTAGGEQIVYSLDAYIMSGGASGVVTKKADSDAETESASAVALTGDTLTGDTPAGKKKGKKGPAGNRKGDKATPTPTPPYSQRGNA